MVPLSVTRNSPVEEEEEVDWHEEDDPAAVQPVKKGVTAQRPTHVLELEVPVPTRWSTLCYMTERCTAVTVLWDPFSVILCNPTDLPKKQNPVESRYHCTTCASVAVTHLQQLPLYYW